MSITMSEVAIRRRVETYPPDVIDAALEDAMRIPALAAEVVFDLCHLSLAPVALDNVPAMLERLGVLSAPQLLGLIVAGAIGSDADHRRVLLAFREAIERGVEHRPEFPDLCEVAYRRIERQREQDRRLFQEDRGAELWEAAHG